MKKRYGMGLSVLTLVLVMVLCACGSSNSSKGTETNLPSKQPEATTAGTVLPPVSAGTHVDEDGDEICDDCGIKVIVDLDFYGFNDLHGVFCDTQGNPGVDELTTYLKNAFADPSAYEILLSSGDMWQGSVESSSNKGQLMTEWMNEMGFAAMTLGNHEYDWGSQYIAQNAQLAEFPFLGINVRDANVEAPYYQSSVTVEYGGVKIGIIGAVSNWISSISGEFTQGLEFVTGNALTQMVKEESVKLRQEGCQLIVYSIHAGQDNSYSSLTDFSGKFGYYDTELSQGYVDLVFEGHSHQDYVLRDREGVYHLQGGGYNSGLSYASVRYDLVNNTYEVRTASTLDRDTFADATLTDDPIVAQLYSKYFPEEDPYQDVIGRNDTARGSTEIAQTVAQLYLEKARELWGEQYEIVLGGGFIQCRSPYKLPAGNVTYSQLYSLLPFDNDLVLCRMTGRQLRQKMIGSERYSCAYDEAVIKAIGDDEWCYVVTDTYTSFYKNNLFEEVERWENHYARDLLQDHIAAGKWSSQAQRITIAQANAIGNGLKPGQTTQQIYQLSGTIIKVVSDLYGNVYIQDEAGDSIYLYGLYDSHGNRYDQMVNPPRTGDTITVTGTITNYVSRDGSQIVEIKGANLQ